MKHLLQGLHGVDAPDDKPTKDASLNTQCFTVMRAVVSHVRSQLFDISRNTGDIANIIFLTPRVHSSDAGDTTQLQ